jgi:hypothetical protein
MGSGYAKSRLLARMVQDKDAPRANNLVIRNILYFDTDFVYR